MAADTPIYNLDLATQGLGVGSDRLEMAAVTWPESIRRAQHALWSGWGAQPYSIGCNLVMTANTTIDQRIVIPPGTSSMLVELDLIGSGRVTMSFSGETSEYRDYSFEASTPPGRPPGVLVGVDRVDPLDTGTAVWTHRDQTLTLDFQPDTDTTLNAILLTPLF